ncbi:MAG TPA: transposase, partial [Clostridiales bacterium UBA8153]|nr:transposase [Clostridiales bacterium UBA8153]
MVKAGPWFSSSQLGSACGAVKNVFDLEERTYVCAGCGASLTGTLTAATAWGVRAASSAVTAWGVWIR